MKHQSTARKPAAAVLLACMVGCKAAAPAAKTQQGHDSPKGQAAAKPAAAAAAVDHQAPAKDPESTPSPSPRAPPGPAAPDDVAAPPADAEKTASGLASKVLLAGSGAERPERSDVVKVHYSGWTTDGRLFDSSVKRGRPAEFRLDRVIAGWTEGLQLMVPGEKRRFWIPEKLAYAGRPGTPQGMLVFDVELLGFKKPPKPPQVPKDVAGPPKRAKRSKSGLAWRVLSKGTGKKRPKATNNVQVHYSGWTTDGKLFDSSLTRGAPASFPLNQVIPGWTEGVQLMVEGEKRRLWIPEELAYKGQRGPPAGMLVFDIELLKILD